MPYFLDQTPQTIAEGWYDTSQLNAVLDALPAEATVLAEGRETRLE